MTGSLRRRILSHISVLLILILLALSFCCQPADARVKVYDTTFRYGRDNNSFGNYAGSLKYKGKYYFGALQLRKNSVLRNHHTLISKARKNYKVGKKPDGLCYGMCLAMALSFNGRIKPKAYVNSNKVKSFFKLPTADRYGVSNQLWEAISSFQLLQYAVSKRRWNNYDWPGMIGDFLLVKRNSGWRVKKSYGRRFIRLIKKRCKRNQVTVLGLTDVGHATLVTGIRETKKNYIIKMYDPNYVSCVGKLKRQPFIKIRKKDFITTGYTLLLAKIKYRKGKYLLKDQKAVSQKIDGGIIVLDDKKLLNKYQRIEWMDKYNEGLYARPSVSKPYDVRSYGKYAPERISKRYIYNRKDYKFAAGVKEMLKGIGAGTGEDIGQLIDADNRFFKVENE